LSRYNIFRQFFRLDNKQYFQVLGYSYLRFSPVRTCTGVFSTCIFQPCKMSCFVLAFSILAFSSTCNFSVSATKTCFKNMSTTATLATPCQPLGNVVLLLSKEVQRRDFRRRKVTGCFRHTKRHASQENVSISTAHACREITLSAPVDDKAVRLSMLQQLLRS